MVKGTKRAIPIEKILQKNSRAVCFSKRRDGLFSKAADLCLLSDSQIAILATPSSSNSNASFFSLGHSSVDAVVAAFLAGKRPVPVPLHREDVGICLRRKDLGLGFWWDDERLAKSEDPEELRAAMDSVSRLLQNLKELHSEEAVDNQIDHRHQTNFVDGEYLKKNNETKKSDKTQEVDHQTLDSKPTCVISDNHNQDLVNDAMKKREVVSDHATQKALNIQYSYAISDDYLETDKEFPAISGNFCKKEMDLEKSEAVLHNGTQDQTVNLQSSCEIISDDYEIPAISENFCNNQEVDLDQLIDFGTLWFDGELEDFSSSYNDSNLV